MTLVDSFNICPYTGLRSFTEEESLYFKGRDEQIDQICQLLEKNKFLMITGASGEGKSSLVYAGLIPNARAGFFKAKYNNWVVVDFRPERSPLSNLSRSLSEKLGYQEEIVSTELKRGYSSLIDLYKSSDYYIDGCKFVDPGRSIRGVLYKPGKLFKWKDIYRCTNRCEPGSRNF
jgi:energy-coupling factor transporter ATP-binding protein EcfA2